MKQGMTCSGKRIGQGIALVLLLALLLCDGGIASAQNLSAEFFSPSDPKYSYTVRYDTLEDLINTLRRTPLQGQLQGFNQNTDQFSVYSNAGGLAITILAPQNSSDFTLSVPGLTYTKTFTGDNRFASTASILEWAAADPDGIVVKVEGKVEADAAAGASGQAGVDNDTGCFISTIR